MWKYQVFLCAEWMADEKYIWNFVVAVVVVVVAVVTGGVAVVAYGWHLRELFRQESKRGRNKYL